MKGISYWVRLRSGQAGMALKRSLLGPRCASFGNIKATFCHSGQARDYALPNSSWSKDMMSQFNKFMEMTKDGVWRRVTSHRRLVDDLHVIWGDKYKAAKERAKESETRFFLRNLDVDGLGFEYVMFWNASEKRMVCIFQLGPYLESFTGFVHGGCIATMLDNTAASCGLMLMGEVYTANLNINYKSPIMLNSVVLVDSKIDKIEGRKIFISVKVQSKDRETLHADATGLLIQMDSKQSAKL